MRGMKKAPPWGAFPVRPRGLEPPRTIQSTRPSTSISRCRCFCERLNVQIAGSVDRSDGLDAADAVTGVVTVEGDGRRAGGAGDCRPRCDRDDRSATNAQRSAASASLQSSSAAGASSSPPLTSASSGSLATCLQAPSARDWRFPGPRSFSIASSARPRTSIGGPCGRDSVTAARAGLRSVPSRGGIRSR
jgi:hypothetical protein